MCLDPSKRLGHDDRKDIQKHPFFKHIDWDKVLNKEYEAPFVPIEKLVKQKTHNFEDFDYCDDNSPLNRVENFTYIKKLT